MLFVLGIAFVGLIALAGIVVLVMTLMGARNVEVVNVRPPQRDLSFGGDDIAALLREGRKIEAIKAYRERTGVGLKEAKDAVDAMERGQLPPKSAGPVLRQVEDAEIEAEIRSGNLLNAIKLYREKTGVGLKDAKDAVEAWRDRLRAS